MSETPSLPDAAWYAEQIMGWYCYTFLDARQIWMEEFVERDHTGKRVALVREMAACDAWDPQNNDTDALQMMLHLATTEDDIMLNLVGKTWGCHIGQESLKRPRWQSEGWSKTFRLAICSAAYAWWQAKHEEEEAR